MKLISTPKDLNPILTIRKC